MKCSFCSKVFSKGTGKVFVKTDGKVFYFCSNKCEKNLLKLKRKPRVIKWTGEYQTIKKEASSADSKKKAVKKRK